MQYYMPHSKSRDLLPEEKLAVKASRLIKKNETKEALAIIIEMEELVYQRMVKPYNDFSVPCYCEHILAWANEFEHDCK